MVAGATEQHGPITEDSSFLSINGITTEPVAYKEPFFPAIRMLLTEPRKELTNALKSDLAPRASTRMRAERMGKDVRSGPPRSRRRNRGDATRDSRSSSVPRNDPGAVPGLSLGGKKNDPGAAAATLGQHPLGSTPWGDTHSGRVARNSTKSRISESSSAKWTCGMALGSPAAAPYPSARTALGRMIDSKS